MIFVIYQIDNKWYSASVNGDMTRTVYYDHSSYLEAIGAITLTIMAGHNVMMRGIVKKGEEFFLYFK